MSTNASNTTPHFGLSQWEGTDYIRREDFNADNAVIDAVLHAQEQRMTLVRLAEIAIADEQTSITIDLSDVDLTGYTKLVLQGVLPAPTLYGRTVKLHINDNKTVGDYCEGHFYYPDSNSTTIEGAAEARDHIAVGHGIPHRGGTFFEAELCDAGTHLICIPHGYTASLVTTTASEGTVLYNRNKPAIWRRGKLADITKLELSYYNVNASSYDSMAGQYFLLCGWKK